MVRLVLLVLAFLGGADRLAAQEKVDARGITSVIKLEETVFGHLTELAHTAENRSSQQLRILFLEILPKDWAAPTVIPPKAH